MRKLCTDFGRRQAPSALYVRYLVKKVKEICILIDKPKRESQKQSAHPRILLLWQKVCVKRHQHQFTAVLKVQLNILEIPLRRILPKDLGMTPYKNQLVQELKPIDHPLRFRFAKRACDRLTKDGDFVKKNYLFRWSSFLTWRVCKQAKWSHLGHRKFTFNLH